MYDIHKVLDDEPEIDCINSVFLTHDTPVDDDDDLDTDLIMLDRRTPITIIVDNSMFTVKGAYTIDDAFYLIVHPEG